MFSKNLSYEQLKSSDFDVFNRLIAVPMVILNNNQVLFMNHAFENVFGYTLESHDKTFMTPFKELVDHMIKEELFIDQGELCVTTKFCKEFWIEHKSRMISYENQTYLLMQCTDARDTKKIKRHLSQVIQLRETMLEVTQYVSKVNAITEIYNLILKSAINAMDHASLGTIMLTEGDYLKTVTQIGYKDDELKSFKLSIKDHFLCKAVGSEMDRISKINNLEEYGEYHKIETTLGEGVFIRASISAPLYINKHLFGVINIDSNETDAFTDDDVALVTFVRNTLEIAISNQLLYEEKTRLSRFDSLTGLFNRHYFEEVFEVVLEKSIRYNERFNLVVFDLNNLKKTNDKLGHLAGDTMINHFASSCKSIMRKSDILCRYGGDEFVGIFFNCSQENLRKRIDGHLKTLKDSPIDIKNKHVVCSYSYGISVFNSNGSSLSELFKVADDQMYENKMRYKTGFDLIDTVELR